MDATDPMTMPNDTWTRRDALRGWLAMVALSAALVVACADDGGQGASPTGVVNANYVVDGEALDVSFAATLTREDGVWVLHGWDDAERYGVTISWDPDTVDAPSTWTDSSSIAPVQIALVHPRLDHAEHIHITATTGGEVTFTELAAGSVAGNFGGVEIVHREAGMTTTIRLDSGSFSSVMP